MKILLKLKGSPLMVIEAKEPKLVHSNIIPSTSTISDEGKELIHFDRSAFEYIIWDDYKIYMRVDLDGIIE